MSLTNKQKQDILDLIYSPSKKPRTPSAVEVALKEHGLTEDNLFVRGEPVIIPAEVVKNILWQRNSPQIDTDSIGSGCGIISGPYRGSSASFFDSFDIWRMVITPYSPSPERIHISELRYPNS